MGNSEKFCIFSFLLAEGAKHPARLRGDCESFRGQSSCLDYARDERRKLKAGVLRSGVSTRGTALPQPKYQTQGQYSRFSRKVLPETCRLPISNPSRWP